MKTVLIVGCGFAVAFQISIASAQMSMGPDYYARVREGNALRDSARAQEKQADSLRHIERMEHDRFLREDRESRTFNRDRRDSYRR